MREFVIKAVAARDKDFLIFIGTLRSGKPKVSRKKTLDWKYLDWLMSQDCAICGRGEVEGIQVAACHVARVGRGSGTGIKPLFNAIPGCHHCHFIQHQKGESAVGGKDQWDAWSDEYLLKFTMQTILEKFGMHWEEPLKTNYREYSASKHR